MAQVSAIKATWKLLDASRSSFRQLDNFFFAESCACNDEFDTARNDGKKNIYIAVQDADMKLSIRSLNVIDNLQLKDEFVMDVRLKDGTEKLTSFGSKLTASGMLWLCVFNRNTVVGVDLLTKTIVHEIMNVPCPNDVCLSPTDPNLLYVAGGASLKNEVAGNSTDELIVVMPPIGCIYEVDIRKGDSRKLQSSGDLSSLAGIDLVNGKLYISQLFNVLSAPMAGSGSTLKELTAWRGTETSEQDCYFADNLSQWDANTLAVSIYRYMDAKSIPAMQNSAVSTVGWCCGKMVTTVVNCITCAPNAIDNAELLMQFSTKDKFAHVHFVLLHAGAGDSGDRRWHFKLDSSTLSGKLPEGCEFDGHVTHVQRHGGKVVFVNFKSPCVLLLDEAVVLDAMK